MSAGPRRSKPERRAVVLGIAFSMMLVAISLAIGLLFGNVLLPPRRLL